MVTKPRLFPASPEKEPEMSDVTQHARAAVDAFQDAFNAQDHERLAAALNYPHVRLWSGVFTQIDTPEEFAEISRRGQSQLEPKAGIHDTACHGSRATGPDKAHCALQDHRPTLMARSITGSTPSGALRTRTATGASSSVRVSWVTLALAACPQTQPPACRIQARACGLAPGLDRQ